MYLIQSSEHKNFCHVKLFNFGINYIYKATASTENSSLKQIYDCLYLVKQTHKSVNGLWQVLLFDLCTKILYLFSSVLCFPTYTQNICSICNTTISSYPSFTYPSWPPVLIFWIQAYKTILSNLPGAYSEMQIFLSFLNPSPQFLHSEPAGSSSVSPSFFLPPFLSHTHTCPHGILLLVH